MRLMGLGDVAAIGVPAARWLKQHHPDDTLTFLSLGAGAELMKLVPEVDRVMAIQKEDWPSDLGEGMQAFAALGQQLVEQGVELLVNFDTFFLPCFMTRWLHDAGLPVAGNSLRWSIDEFVEMLQSGKFTQEMASSTRAYAQSTFPRFDDWTTPWWLEQPHAGPYPDFYLRHCCDFEGPFDAHLDVAADEEFRASAGGRPIVALAASGRTRTRDYPHAEALRAALEAEGYLVWNRFDGSQPMEKTLGQLRVTDLLVTVATAPQWLARAVGCPSLMIPGTVPPETLCAEITMPQRVDCQYCMQRECAEERDFECLDVAPADVVARAKDYLEVPGRGGA